MFARRGRSLAATAVAVGALAILPATAFAGRAVVKSATTPMGSGTSVTLSCTAVNLPGTVKAQTYTFPYSAATAAQIDQLIAQLGLAKYVAPLPAGAGVLTISVIPNGTCGTGGGTA